MEKKVIVPNTSISVEGLAVASDEVSGSKNACEDPGFFRHP
jgi:hypothetical protein